MSHFHGHLEEEWKKPSSRTYTKVSMVEPWFSNLQVPAMGLQVPTTGYHVTIHPQHRFFFLPGRVQRSGLVISLRHCGPVSKRLSEVGSQGDWSGSLLKSRVVGGQQKPISFQAGLGLGTFPRYYSSYNTIVFCYLISRKLT